MPAVEITFRTAAELAGARQVQANLERQIGQAKALGKDYSDLSKQLASVNQRIKDSGQAGSFKDILAQIPGMDRLSGIFSSIGTKVGLFATALGGAATTAAKAIQEYSAAERAVAGLDAALAQHGLLNEKTRQDYQALAAELQKTTAVADDEWIRVLTRLTQFGSRPETIGMDVKAVKDLAGVLGGDVQQAVLMYAKALEGQFQAFSRLGLAVDEHASKVEKLRQLQEKLAIVGGGQLEAFAKTIQGRFQSLKNSFSDFMEAIGRGIARTGMLQNALGAIAEGFDFWAGKLGGTIDQVDGLSNASVTAEASMEGAAEASRLVAEGLAQLKSESAAAESAVQALVGQIGQLEHAEKQIADARRKNELAKLELRFKRGEIKEPEFMAAKAKLEERGRTEDAARQLQTLQKQRDLIEFELLQRQEREKELTGSLAQEEAKLRQVEGREKALRSVRLARDSLRMAEEDVRNINRDLGQPGVGHQQLQEALAIVEQRRTSLAQREAEAEPARQILPGLGLTAQTGRVATMREQLEGMQSANAPVMQRLWQQGAEITMQMRQAGQLGPIERETGQLRAQSDVAGALKEALEKRRQMEEEAVSTLQRVIEGESPVTSLRDLSEILRRTLGLTVDQIDVLRAEVRRFEAQLRDQQSR